MHGLALAIAAAALGPAEEVPPQVAASVETAPATDSKGDTADDPAIWRNRANPAKSLILSTDKKAGIAIHGLSGRLLSFQPLGDLNNVDLRDDVMIAGAMGTLVAASDRSDKDIPLLHLFRLDPATPTLVPIGTIASPKGQAYGLCLHRRGDEIDAFMVHKEGIIEQISLDLSKPVAAGKVVRRFNLKSRSEGCVADDRTGQLYVAEDKVALWRIDTSPDRPMTPVKIADVDGIHLHKDVEGLAILSRGRNGGFLFASSQGDNRFAVFRLPDGMYVGGFRIAGGAIDGTEDTDGIAVHPGDFGTEWPGGLFVAQDGKNLAADGKKAAQNFKLVPLAAILKVIGNGK
ncbi:MAG: phytase [Sphingopyxis sp.]|nr:phytase [Sphingopyxis sp.]